LLHKVYLGPGICRTKGSMKGVTRAGKSCTGRKGERVPGGTMRECPGGTSERVSGGTMRECPGGTGERVPGRDRGECPGGTGERVSRRTGESAWEGQVRECLEGQ